MGRGIFYKIYAPPLAIGSERLLPLPHPSMAFLDHWRSGARRSNKQQTNNAAQGD
jgi:hypothetical protein